MNIYNYLIILFLSKGLGSHQNGPSPTWYYSSNGIEDWPESCKGSKQSPIDISDYNVDVVEFSKLKLVNYDKPVKCNSINNGHTVMLDIDKKENLYMTGSNVSTKYSLQQIHFHWESEHTLNGKRYPLEVHFVHVANKHRHRRHTDVQDVGGIHVLAAFYFVNKNLNRKLSKTFELLKNVSHIGATDSLTIIPRSLLPLNLAEFYQYEGSLTTPNCNENVQWTIFKSGIPISTEQYAIIKSSETFNGSNSINYRNTQPLNNRPLKYVFSPTSAGNVGQTVCNSVKTLYIVFIGVKILFSV